MFHDLPAEFINFKVFVFVVYFQNLDQTLSIQTFNEAFIIKSIYIFFLLHKRNRLIFQYLINTFFGLKQVLFITVFTRICHFIKILLSCFSVIFDQQVPQKFTLCSNLHTFVALKLLVNSFEKFYVCFYIFRLVIILVKQSNCA